MSRYYIYTMKPLIPICSLSLKPFPLHLSLLPIPNFLPTPIFLVPTLPSHTPSLDPLLSLLHPFSALSILCLLLLSPLPLLPFSSQTTPSQLSSETSFVWFVVFYSTYLIRFVTLACTKTSSQLPLDRCYALFQANLTRLVGRIVTTDHSIPSLYKGRQCTFCQCNPLTIRYTINNINVHTTVYVHVLRLAQHTSCDAPPTNGQCRCGDLSTSSEYHINKHLVCKTCEHCAPKV